VEKAAVGTGADLIDDIGLEITVDGTRDVLALASLGEESAEPMVGVALLTLLSEVTIGLNTVLEAVKLSSRTTVSSPDTIQMMFTSRESRKIRVELSGIGRRFIPPSRNWRSGNQPDRRSN
jgi:hypothetical protein